MITTEILTYIRNWFSQIILLGSNIILFNFNGITVSLNQFLLAMFIMSIVITTLVSAVSVGRKDNTGDTMR